MNNKILKISMFIEKIFYVFQKEYFLYCQYKQITQTGCENGRRKKYEKKEL